jgi:hypothetical protein
LGQTPRGFPIDTSLQYFSGKVYLRTIRGQARPYIAVRSGTGKTPAGTRIGRGNDGRGAKCDADH